MKKVLAVMLALTMALGMTTVAMASASKPDNISFGFESSSTIYTLNGKTMSKVDDDSRLDPGETYYLPITSLDDTYNKGMKNITSVSAVSNYRLRPSISEGRTVLGTIEFVTKSVSTGNPISDSKLRSNTTGLFIAFTVKESSKTEDIDLSVDFNIYGSTSGSTSYEIEGKDEGTFPLNTVVGYGRREVSGLTVDVSDSYPLINFDECDNEEISIYFMSADTDFRFDVNANGQKETILRYSDDPETSSSYQAIVDKYPDADLSFHLLGGASFKRTGKLYIPASQIDGNNGKPYLYEVTGGKITDQKATYNKDDEMFVVSTNKLGNYVVSDTKLKAGSTSSEDESSDDEDDSSSEVDPIPPDNSNQQINPDTGSKDIVAIAAVLAVVSLAAIGATTLKKRNKK